MPKESKGLHDEDNPFLVEISALMYEVMAAIISSKTINFPSIIVQYLVFSIFTPKTLIYYKSHLHAQSTRDSVRI
jgi:hypothetical protein